MIGRSALVIDDSKSARFALRRYLESHRYQVEAVETADEGMRVLERSRPDVIFLDHVMPGVDGFTVLRDLRANPATARIPVVICSSNDGPEFTARARAAGATCVLLKPPNPEQLYRILDELERVPETVENGGAFAPTRFEVTPARPAAPVSPLLGSVSASAPGSMMSTSSEAALRDQLELRLKKVSQGLFVQFAEIKATVAHLASQQAKLAEAPNALRTDMRNGLHETNQALRLVTSRIEAIEREMFSQLTAMRTHVDSTLKAHAERVSELAQVARQAAAEEAQVVAERTVMSAALRISDQLADAILGAVGRR